MIGEWWTEKELEESYRGLLVTISLADSQRESFRLRISQDFTNFISNAS